MQYYLEKHPRAYEGMEEIYLLTPTVKFLRGEPPTIQPTVFPTPLSQIPCHVTIPSGAHQALDLAASGR